MGNCQAAEAATVVIQHPGNNKVERIYWSVSARQVMSSNPGHYVALVLTSPTLKSENGTPARQLKLLRPGDTLLLGQVYRLISVQDVLKEFAAKKCVKLGKLLKEGGLLVGIEIDQTTTSTTRKNAAGPTPNCPSSVKTENRVVHRGGNGYGRGMGGRHRQHQGGGGGSGGGGGQWKPALQSIAEIGT